MPGAVVDRSVRYWPECLQRDESDARGAEHHSENEPAQSSAFSRMLRSTTAERLLRANKNGKVYVSVNSWLKYVGSLICEVAGELSVHQEASTIVDPTLEKINDITQKFKYEKSVCFFHLFSIF